MRLDVNKAFDGVSYSDLFSVSAAKGIVSDMVRLMKMHYKHQTGGVDVSNSFHIGRRVQ